MEDEYNKYFADHQDIDANALLFEKDDISLYIDPHHYGEDLMSDCQANQNFQQSGNSNEFFLHRLDAQSSSANMYEDKSTKSSIFANRTKIFNIIRDEPIEEEEVFEMSENSKPISKKHQKSKAKSSKYGDFIDTSYINKQIAEEMKAYEHLDEKSKKKMVQMLRNRISAQTSRDRKKVYLSSLEKELEDAHKANAKLMERVKELEAKQGGHVCKSCGRREKKEFNVMETKENEHEYRGSRGNNVSSPNKFFTFFTILSCIMLVALLSNNSSGSGFNREKISFTEIQTRVLPQETVDSMLKEHRNMNISKQGLMCRNHFVGPQHENLMKKLIDMQYIMANRRKNRRTPNATNVSMPLATNPEDTKFLGSSKPSPVAPLYFPEDAETVFFPSGILMDKFGDDSHSQHMNSETILKRFENSSLLQLFIPTRNLSTIKDARNKTKINSEIDTGEMNILEMICDLKTIRQFSA